MKTVQRVAYRALCERDTTKTGRIVQQGSSWTVYGAQEGM